jgi:hypothetical protein
LGLLTVMMSSPMLSWPRLLICDSIFLHRNIILTQISM